MGIKEAPAFSEQGAHPAPCYGLFLIHLHATVDRGGKDLQSWSPLPLVDRGMPRVTVLPGLPSLAFELLDRVQW